MTSMPRSAASRAVINELGLNAAYISQISSLSTVIIFLSALNGWRIEFVPVDILMNKTPHVAIF